jgi:hypothetical protein
MEFMFMMMAATLAMIVFMSVFSELYQDNMSDKKRLLAEDFGTMMQNEFLIASQTRDGYFREFDVPAKLEGYSYGISIRNSTLMINYSSGILFFPVPQHTGALIIGTNNISNFNGTICVNC